MSSDLPDKLSDLLAESPLEVDAVRAIFDSLAGQIERALAAGLLPLLAPERIQIGGEGAREPAIPQETYPYSTPLPENPAFASPERIRGLPQDGRSFAYSLGALLYHALTGQPPFTDENPNMLLYRHISEAPPDPIGLNPGLSPVVAKALMRALSKDPADRFAGPAELIAALGPDALPAPFAAPPADEIASQEVKPLLPEAGLKEKIAGSILRKWPAVILGIAGITLLGACVLFFSSGVFFDLLRIRAANSPDSLAPSAPVVDDSAHFSLYLDVLSWPLQYFEIFDEGASTQWEEARTFGSETGDLRSIQDGTYLWVIDSLEAGFWWARSPRGIGSASFALMVETSSVTGDSNCRYGLLLDQQGTGFYGFEISGPDSARVFFREDPQSPATELLSFRLPEYFDTGGLDTLAMVYQTGHLDFFINERFVGELDGLDPAPIWPGLHAEIDKPPGRCELSFDNFKIRSHSETLLAPCPILEPMAAGSSATPPLTEPELALLAEESLSEAESTWQLIFEDSFDSNDSEWPVFFPFQIIEGGSYRWDIPRIGAEVVHAIPRQTPLIPPYYLAADTRLYDSSGWGHGLVIRNSKGCGTLFQIRSDGHYQLVRVQGEAVGETLVDWTPAAGVEGGGENRLAVIDLGEQVYFYVNGRFTAAWSPDLPPHGEVGLAVSSTEQATVRIVFDHFELRSP